MKKRLPDREGRERWKVILGMSFLRLKFLDLIICLPDACINIEKAFADVTLCCVEEKGKGGGVRWRGGHPRQK